MPTRSGIYYNFDREADLAKLEQMRVYMAAERERMKAVRDAWLAERHNRTYAGYNAMIAKRQRIKASRVAAVIKRRETMRLKASALDSITKTLDFADS